MILKNFLSGEDFEFLGVYTKGKRGREYRFLLKRVSGCSDLIPPEQMFFVKVGVFEGACGEFVYFLKNIGIGHWKAKVYNYYYLDDDFTKLEAELRKYRANATLFPHVASGVAAWKPAYVPVFEFNGVKY